MCPAHSQDHIIINPSNGVATCGECSRIRARVARIKGKNRNVKRARHPRETLAQVPVAPLREQFERLLAAGVTAGEIALRAGWVDKRKGGSEMADLGRLRRTLGLSPNIKRRDGKVYSSLAEEMSYEVAVALCPALEIEYPSEVGV